MPCFFARLTRFRSKSQAPAALKPLKTVRFRKTLRKPLNTQWVSSKVQSMNSTRTFFAALLIAASLVSFTTQTTTPVMPPRVEIEA